MSPGLTLGFAFERSFPRVSGDEPSNEATQTRVAMFSPRERG